jgi:ABC-type antimicrobial peptide transport system permease subunit
MESYYETGELPDVDLVNKQTMAFTYNSNPENSGEDAAAASDSDVVTTDDSDVMGSDSMPRVQIKVAGVMDGGPDSYTQYSYYTLVDNDSLKAYLSKNFRKGHIPGQPLDSHGKAYNEWVYNQAIVNVDESDNVEEVTKAIQDMGFQAESNKELLESAQGVFKIIELVLGGIGMIAFLVAAIGIANTMMMSTYERTKEIGVMKVLGCDMRDILAMFLSEAGCIGFIGGVIGLLFTMLLSAVANALLSGTLAQSMGLPEGSKLSLIPWWLAVGAVVFATLMGTIAGFFPARRAMKLSPLAAIRNE